MTFDLLPEHLTLRDRARALARDVLESEASAIDRSGTIPAALVVRGATLVASGDLMAMVIGVEAIAAASGALALEAAVNPSGGRPLPLAGLRGLTAVADSPRAQLALAAVALGLGGAAVETALANLRQAADHPGLEDGEKPHWVVADAATELDAARMLTWKAAHAHGDAAAPAIAVARLLASAAAQHAVDAALRIAGPAAYGPGAFLERLSRDARAVSLLLGTEERQRAIAADGLLPA